MPKAHRESTAPEKPLRLFFALWPDAAARAAIAAFAHEVAQRAGGRDPREENLHVTLAFVGDVSPDRIAALAAIGTDGALAAPPFMHRMKTGALIRAAVRLGAMAGGPVPVALEQALDMYAAAAGLAFQVVDDVLDTEGSAASLGKTAGKDAAQGKPTFVALLGVAGARERAAQLNVEAHATDRNPAILADRRPGIFRRVARAQRYRVDTCRAR